MALTQLTTDLDVHQSLSNTPNETEGLSATQLKVKYDQAANDIKTYLNSTLTSELDALDAANVKLTGDQTVAGIKTFSSFPVTPSSAPTTDYQSSNKKYVDDSITTHSTSTDHDSIYLRKTNTDAFTPTADYHPATKKYIDDTAIAGVGDNTLTEAKMANEMKKDLSVGVASMDSFINNKFSFDNLLAIDKYRVTEFDTPTAGDITETIKLVSDDSTYATRVTEFDTPTSGDITETITCTALSVSNTFITTFDDPTTGDITETGGTV